MLTLINRDISLDGESVFSGVNVAMDDRTGTVEVKAMKDARYQVVGRYDGATFLWRKASDNNTAYDVDGHLLLIEAAKPCGCGK